MHVFGSLAFLFAITLLFFAYALAAFTLVVSISRYCKQIWEDISRFTYDKATFALHYSFFLPSRKQWFILTTCVLLATGTLYIKNWVRWYSSSAAHPVARQYVIAGMVLKDLRILGNRLFKQERKIWSPLEWLQQMIGKVCFSFIPHDDGERYIWQYYFIIEPYLTPIRNPRSEKVYDLIATDEAIMEHLVQGKTADKKLAAKERYLVFSMTVFHYEFAFKRRYTIYPHPNSYAKGYFQDPE